MAQCEKFEECGREVYYDPTGLCLAHEKERRAKEDRAATRKRREAAKKAAETRRQTTKAKTQTSRPATGTRGASS